MPWFKKSSCESIASHHSGVERQRHKRIKKTTQISTIRCNRTVEFNEQHMTTSLCGVDHSRIQLVDPENFFEDPDHVRNYREEATFLDLMSEWVIVEHPEQFGHNGNYFSADFEDELLQMRTQDASVITAATQRACNDNNDCTETVDVELRKAVPASLTSSISTSLSSTKCAELRTPYRQRITELLFADKIQTGIALPKCEHYAASPRLPRKRKLASKLVADEAQTEVETDTAKHETSGDFRPVAVCPQLVLKDCTLNRAQLKTEALACSIMGAIGKCPDTELPSRLNDLTNATEEDHCHPAFSYGCDHYDIKKFFHLDDEGNILLDINHIEESKGYGFAVAHNKRLYRRYLRQTQMARDYYCTHAGCLKSLQNTFFILWKLIFGHPRNKVNNYGMGTGDSVRSYTLQLALDHNSTFSRNIENFISCTKESREAAPQVVMRNMRQFMNGMKNYLVKHGEGKFHQEVETARSLLKSDEFLNLDAILETVMHQLVVLPLREHLYGMFVDYYTRSEDIQLLAQNVKYACGRCATDFGIRAAVTPPSSAALNVISNLLLRLQEAELPLEKLELFLCVISTIFDVTGCPRGQQLGADDFLPILVYVVAKCGFVGAEIEAEFMWGLLQPTLLNGEPGYYLTALCSAVHVLKSFMASENESGSGSLDWRSSSLPACSSVLRVIIPDECNGSLQTRTLPVRPHTTTREVCRIIAHKARITNPQDYALFKLVDGEETLLSDVECPQDIRLAAKGKHCMLAYKRIDAKIAWPTAAQPVFN